MTRPFCKKKIAFCPQSKGMKPVGLSASQVGEPIYISAAETESLRLKDIEELDQTSAAARMGISQSTFQRLLANAHKKAAQALLEGRGLLIEKE